MPNATRNVTVKVNVKPGSVSELDRAAGAFASQHQRAKPAYMQNWEMRAPRDPVVVKAEKKSFGDAFSPIIAGLAGQMAGKAIGGTAGGLIGGALGGGYIGLATAAMTELLDKITAFPAKLANWKLERQVGILQSYGDALGGVGIAFERQRQYWQTLADSTLPNLFTGAKEELERIRLEQEKAKASLQMVGVYSPGTARRQQMAGEDLQAVAGRAKKGEIEDITRQTRLVADLKLTMQREGLSAEQREALQGFAESATSAKFTKGMRPDQVAYVKQALKEKFGVDLSSATGLAARPASFMGADEYVKSVYQAAFQSGVDPQARTAQASETSASRLSQIGDLLQRVADAIMLGAAQGNRDAIQNGR